MDYSQTKWALQDHQWVVLIWFFFWSMWDIVSTEFLWVLSVQVSKKTTTKKQTARASNKTNKRRRMKKGTAYDTFLYGLSQAQMVSGDKKRVLRAVVYMLSLPMHWERAWQRLILFLKIMVIPKYFSGIDLYISFLLYSLHVGLWRSNCSFKMEHQLT